MTIGHYIFKKMYVGGAYYDPVANLHKPYLGVIDQETMVVEHHYHYQ